MGHVGGDEDERALLHLQREPVGERLDAFVGEGDGDEDRGDLEVIEHGTQHGDRSIDAMLDGDGVVLLLDVWDVGEEIVYLSLVDLD